MRSSTKDTIQFYFMLAFMWFVTVVAVVAIGIRWVYRKLFKRRDRTI